jgi:peptide deformylase
MRARQGGRAPAWSDPEQGTVGGECIMLTETLPTSIVRYPDPRLRRKCKPVEVFDESLAALVERMFEIMRKERGVGLAAPQVGVSRLFFICNPTGKPEDDAVYINPRLSDLVGAVEAEEGCLSFPEIHATVRRARRCRIQAQDLAGQPIDQVGEDLVSRIWQHEMDHLEGRLIVDRMNDTDKIANKKLLSDLEVDYRSHSKKK